MLKKGDEKGGDDGDVGEGEVIKNNDMYMFKKKFFFKGGIVQLIHILYLRKAGEIFSLYYNSKLSASDLFCYPYC